MYKQVISLGWFCSVASELEKLGLRTASYPFDWILTDWKTVYEMIEGSCSDFLEADKLEQDPNVSNMYRHKERKCLTYVHDIDPYENYMRQIREAQSKYDRRLERLRKDMCAPSIFVRYIMDAEEYQFIVKNRDKIEKWLKKFHPENKIVYIANSEFGQESFVWSVEKDEGDEVARNFMEQLPELKRWFEEQNYVFSREANLEWYRKKQWKKKRARFLQKIRHGCRRLERLIKRTR